MFVINFVLDLYFFHPPKLKDPIDIGFLKNIENYTYIYRSGIENIEKITYTS